MKKNITLTLFIISCKLLLSQNQIDALRYSFQIPDGSARYMGLNGAFGALGGDISAIAINPANMSIYKKSEFLIASQIYYNGSSSSFMQKKAYDSKYNFNIPLAGSVFVFDNMNSIDWISTQLALGYIRTNNFNYNYSISSDIPTNTLLNLYLNQVNETGTSIKYPFDAELAYNTHLINPLPGDSLHYSAVINEANSIQKNISSQGRNDEFFVSFSGNFRDKLLMGIYVGVPTINYYEQSKYKEIAKENDTTTSFNNFIRYENLTTTGRGINAKLGFLFKASDWLRFGLAFYSPDFYRLTDNWNAQIDAEFDTASYSAKSPQGIFNYRLTTIPKIIGSVGIILGKYGLLSADYEFLDYSQALLHSNDYPFYNENEAIKESYKQSSILRIGTEWRANPLYFRTGYAFYESPYKQETGNDGSVQSFSLGLGYRVSDYFFDIAYVYALKSENLYLHSLSNDAVHITNAFHKITFSFGYKF